MDGEPAQGSRTSQGRRRRPFDEARPRALDPRPARAPRAARDEAPAPSPGWRRLAWKFFDSFKDDLAFIVAASIAALLRAMGVTVESGQTGLLFTFGRAKRELEPGFHLLIPFAQTARKLPTRSRTMDLPAQRVTTYDGLVYLVDANFVYRITDVRKALIQIDDLERGMLQMLGLAVQEVVRAASGAEIGASGALDERFHLALDRRLAVWGVTVESAGFPSIRPSPRTLRITQLEKTVNERRRQLAELEPLLGDRASALALVGTRRMPRTRARAMQRFLRAHRRVIRLHRTLQARGWSGARVKAAELRAMDQLAAQRRPGVFLR
ncbi:MAG: SPFH domain-containing protein [Planctomycetota bacterium]